MTNTIRLRFVAEYGLLSRLICWRTNSRYSHVGILVDDPEHGRVEIGARFFADKAFDGGRGIRRRPADYARFKRVLTLRIEVSELQYAKFHQLLRTQIGRSYDWRAVASFIFGRSLRFTHAFDCSALVIWLLGNARITYQPRLAKRRFSPGDVLIALSAACETFVEEKR